MIKNSFFRSCCYKSVFLLLVAIVISYVALEESSYNLYHMMFFWPIYLLIILFVMPLALLGVADAVFTIFKGMRKVYCGKLKATKNGGSHSGAGIE